MKNGKVVGASELVPKIVKPAVEAGVDMVTDLINQILVEKKVL